LPAARAFHGSSTVLACPRALSALSIAAAVLLRSARLFQDTDVGFAFFGTAATGAVTTARD